VRIITIKGPPMEVPVGPQELAQAFAQMDDEQQAQFFIEVAKIAKEWPNAPLGGAEMQWIRVGVHLRKCECSTEEARDLVRTIALGIEP
jgi:hypothetical protein